MRAALAEYADIPRLSCDAIRIRYDWHRLRSAARGEVIGDAYVSSSAISPAIHSWL